MPMLDRLIAPARNALSLGPVHAVVGLPALPQDTMAAFFIHEADNGACENSYCKNDLQNVMLIISSHELPIPGPAPIENVQDERAHRNGNYVRP